MSYSDLFGWLENYIQFNEKIDNGYYKNKDLVEKDIGLARDVFESKNTKDRRVQTNQGWKTITKEQSSDGFEKFVKNAMRPMGNKSVKDENEEMEDKMGRTRQNKNIFGLREISVSDYEEPTKERKEELLKELQDELTRERVEKRREFIEVREQRDSILEQAYDEERSKTGFSGISVSRRTEIENELVGQGRIESRDEYLKKSKALE